MSPVISLFMAIPYGFGDSKISALLNVTQLAIGLCDLVTNRVLVMRNTRHTHEGEFR
jgi:hypothetical protein